MNDVATVVGVLGDDRAADVARRLAGDRLDVDPEVDPSRPRSDLDVVVAVGERGVIDGVTATVDVPLVPVGAGEGLGGVSIAEGAALRRPLAAREWSLEHHRPLEVTVNGDRITTAVFDVTLVTAEAARISEYAVRADGDRVDAARADGVVIATPAGSHGYARRVGAPVLASADGLAGAWIAPFRSDPDRWVLDPATLSVSVERDETAVDLLVDERAIGTVGPTDDVIIEPGDPFAIAHLPTSEHG
jgi:NAD+ kinase